MLEMSLMQAGLDEGCCTNFLYPPSIPHGWSTAFIRKDACHVGRCKYRDWTHAACDSGAEQSVFGANAAAVCLQSFCVRDDR